MKTQAEENQPGILRSLDTWWFGHGSAEAIGLFRVVVGFLAFTNLLMISLDFNAWFTETGFVPVAANQRYSGEFVRFNPLIGVTDARITLSFYVLVCLAALLTTVGLWTRVSSIALALGMVALHHRNMMILHGGDTLLRMCLIYIAVAPSGAACSLDRLIALWKGRQAADPVLVPLWGQRLVQFQVAVLYVTTVWHKWRGIYWRDGTATWYPAQLTEFDRFWVPPFLETPAMVKATTYGTLIVELALGTLVFYRPLRKWVLLAGLGLHGFIEWRYNIPLFQYVMVSTYICFFEGHEIRDWAKRLGRRLRPLHVEVRLPAGKALAPQAQAAIDAADPLDLVSVGAGEGENWSAKTQRGRAVNPFISSWIRSLGAFPLGFVPGLWKRLLKTSTVDAATGKTGASK